MFRKHFPLPWTAIWPMTKNSTGTWQSSQSRVERNLREVMSAPGNLLYWLDLSFWSSFYFISSQAATWMLIFYGNSWLNSNLSVMCSWLAALVSCTASLTSFTPPGWAESRVSHHATWPSPVQSCLVPQSSVKYSVWVQRCLSRPNKTFLMKQDLYL